MDDQERLARFLKRTPLEWPQIFADSLNCMVADNRVTAFPSNFLLDPDGRILQRDLNHSELEKILKGMGCIK